MLDGIDVGLGLVEVGRDGGDELGAGLAEELLEDGEGLGATSLQLQQLITILLPKSGVDRVVETGVVEGNADGDESVHLLVLLGDGVVLGALLEVLGPRDVDQDVAEHADGIAVAAHHHVRESHVVVGGEVGGHNPGEHGLLVQLDVVERLEGEAEVAEKTVDAEQSDDGEVPQHLVEVLGTIVSGDGHGLLVPLHGGELLGYLRLLDKRVEHVKHTVASPRVWVLAKHLHLVGVVALAGNAGSVGGEGVELVDEFVDDIPRPVVLFYSRTLLANSTECARTILTWGRTNRWGLKVDGALRVEDIVEQAAVLVVALELCF